MRLPELSGCVLQVAEAATEMDGDQKKFSNYSYPAMTKTQGSFRLRVEAGQFTDSEIIVMLGENGTGTVPFAPPNMRSRKSVMPTVAMSGQCATLHFPNSFCVMSWRRSTRCAMFHALS